MNEGTAYGAGTGAGHDPGCADAACLERYAFTEVFADGQERPAARDVPVEAPVAIEVNGVGLAVMMATPMDLEDFAVGFARAERLIAVPGEMLGVQVARVETGWIVRLDLRGEAADAALARVRTRVTESACGLCGVESLDALARPLPRVAAPVMLTRATVERALADLSTRQALGRRTGGTHAAALCRADGRVVLLREDVGRHNALDKLVGAAIRAALPLRGRFALVTSRLSFELVEKAVHAGLGGLVALSAPTTLALERAAEAGLPVVALARDHSMLRDPVRS